jgi:hypothetical protein
MFLMARLNERGRNILMVRTVREAAVDATAHRIIAERCRRCCRHS